MAIKLALITAFSALTTLSLAQSSNPFAGLSTLSESIPTYSATGPISVVSVFLYNTAPVPVLASVIEANPSVTTYHIECPSTIDCGWIPSATLTVSAKSVYDISLTDTNFTMSLDCTVGSSAVCHESFAGGDANFPGSSDETLTGTDFALVPLTITGGLEKLTNATATATTGTGAKTSSGGSGAKQTGSSTTGSNAAGQGVALWMPTLLLSFAAVLLVL